MRTVTYSILLFLLFFSISGYGADDFEYDTGHLPQINYRPHQIDGFCISLSLTALFTTGTAHRDGLRWGAGITVSQTFDEWTILAGIDFYKDLQSFAPGITYAGLKYENNGYGASYLLSHYFQEDRQTSGIINLKLKDFHLRFEDDLLAFPVTGFKIEDRYRTAGLEIGYKGFFIGTNIYTTDIDGLVEASDKNPLGRYKNGYQLSSPIYAGYSHSGLLLRLGWNNSTGGYIGQNLWHRLLFKTPDFKQGDYSNFFMQAGTDKAYTLY